MQLSGHLEAQGLDVSHAGIHILCYSRITYKVRDYCAMEAETESVFAAGSMVAIGGTPF